jgi:hypothetical protein
MSNNRSHAAAKRKRNRLVVILIAATITAGMTSFGAALAAGWQPFQGSLADAATAAGPSNDFDHVLGRTGVDQTELNAVDTLLTGVQVTVRGKLLPNYGIAEAALDYAHTKIPGHSVDVTDLARTIAVQALQLELYEAGVASGLGVSSSEMDTIADSQESLFNSNPDPALLPVGKTADQYFHSADYRTAYAQALTAKRMKDAIVAGRTGSSASSAIRQWASAKFDADVLITGLAGVTPATLANFL